ncbi:MAG: VWA domain-containing protein [Deinococcales bacterium]
MSFASPEMLLLLLLVPLAWFGLFWLEARRKNTAQAYADAHLLGSTIKTAPRVHSNAPRVLQLLALALLLFTASRPSATLSLPQNKAAVMIALDTSRSMLATDVEPSRLELAKTIIKDFIQLAPSDTLIGLVTFSESAAAVVPATTDRAQLLERLEKVKTSNTTSLADPIVAGVKSLPGRVNAIIPRGLPGAATDNQVSPNLSPQAKPIDIEKLPPGAMLILSDGVGNVGADVRLAAQFAKTYKVKLYTVAVGKQGGAVSRIDGQDFFIPFNAETLKQIAQLGEGQAVGTEKADAEKVFKELGTAIRFEPTKLEVSAPASGMAMFFLLLAATMNLLWHRRLV